MTKLQYFGLLEVSKKAPIMSLYYSLLYSSTLALGIYSFIYFLANSYSYGVIMLGLLLISRIISISINLISIIKFKKTDGLLELLKNLFYYDDTFIFSSTYLISFGMKHLVFFYIQSISVLFIIVSQNIEDTAVIICFLMSCFSTISLFLTEIINQSSSKINSIIITVNNFLGMVIVLGFLVICHQIDYFFSYNIIIAILYFALRDLKKPIKSLIGSKHDVISPNQMYMIVFCFLKSQYFGLMRMNQSKKHSKSYLLSHNYEYLVNGYMSIILFIQLALDRELNNLENLQNLRRVFYICTFLFIPFFADILLNMIQFLRFGPYERWIQIDCAKCINYSQDQLKREYLQFKKSQFQITMYIKNIHWEIFDNLLSICLEEKERNFKIEYYHYDSFANKKESVDIDNEFIQPRITLNLYSLEFTQHVMTLLNDLRKNTFLSFRFHFVNPIHIEKKFQIYKQLFKYPHLFAMHEEYSKFSEIKQILPVIKDYQKTMLQIYLFKQEILPYLTINPNQVIYDLLLDD